MRAEYDLVVIGDSLSGRRSALSAARQYARVALIPHGSGASAQSLVYQELADIISASIYQDISLPFESVKGLRLWIVSRVEALLQSYSLNRLCHHGVDVLPTSGSFIPNPVGQSPIFESQGRQLRSRYYLLAIERESAVVDDSKTLINPIPSPPQGDIQVLDNLLRQIESLSNPEEIYLHGQFSGSILVGQILNRLGYSITIFNDEPILSREDPDIAFFLQCQLESEGLTLQLRSDQSAQGQSSIVFNPMGDLPLKGLNLHGIGIDIVQTSEALAPKVIVNQRLETQNSRVLACGDILGGYSLHRMTQYESSLALNNALFQCKKSLKYDQVAYQLPLLPGLSRIGLTEPQARRLLPQVQVMTRAIENTYANSLFCKVIATSSGEIVGIHWSGKGARDSVELFEQIVRASLCIKDLGQVVSQNFQVQEVFQDFAYRWESVQSSGKRDRLEQYFRAKRKQFS